MAGTHIANQFSGLPMQDLIGGPLQAACVAQTNLAQATASFINQVGFDAETGDVKMVAFNFSRPRPDAQTGDGEVAYGEEQVQLNVPFLSLVNTPSLMIKNVKITFDMEVKESTSEKSSTDASLSTNATLKWGLFGRNKVNIQGSVSTHKENTRTTDNSAKYHVEVLAEDNGMPEGLSRVYDILQTAIAPTKITSVDAEESAALADTSRTTPDNPETPETPDTK